MHDTTPRRTFIGRLAAALAAGLLADAPARLRAQRAAGASAADPDVDDRWLDRLTGTHRQLFDMAHPAGGVPLRQMRNFLNTYRDDYRAPERDVNVVGTLYHDTLPLGLDDAMWAKYRLGEAIAVTDPSTKLATTRNLFARPQAADTTAGLPTDAGVVELQRRGALFIMCNNALNNWVGRLASAGGGAPADIRADLLAHMLPGVVLVPAMVVAINKAQARGVTYFKAA